MGSSEVRVVALQPELFPFPAKGAWWEACTPYPSILLITLLIGALEAAWLALDRHHQARRISTFHYETVPFMGFLITDN